MKALKIVLAVILLLVGLLFSLVALGVLSDHDTTGEPTNWLGFCTSASIGIVAVVLGVRTLLRLRKPSPSTGIATRDQTNSKAATVAISSKKSSRSLLGTLVRGGALIAAAGIAADQ